jgi:vancomycin permeability regulator SanA
MEENMKKRLLRALLTLLIFAFLSGIVCVAISSYIVIKMDKKIVSVDTAKSFDADCIMVLGAGIKNNKPSLMLRDRLECAIELYFQNGVPLLMSGDHSTEDYNEVGVMKAYAEEQGVPSEDILLDPEGYSTYESCAGLKEKLGFDKVIIVSQKYHLPRALYIAEEMELDAIGVPCENILYYGHTKRLVREIFARTKDFFVCLF